MDSSQNKNITEDEASSRDDIPPMETSTENPEKRMAELKIQKDDDESLDGDRGDTINLYDAIRKRSLSAVKYYYKQDPDIINETIHPKTPNLTLLPLHFASQLGCLDIVRFLAPKVNIEAINFPSKSTALHMAAYNGKISVVECLLDFGAKINHQGEDGWTSLHNAIYMNHFDIVKLLIERGADKSLKNDKGKNPLKFAEGVDRQLIVKYLSSLK